MKKSKLTTAAILSGGMAMLVAGSAFAAASNTGKGKQVRDQRNRIVIRVASDLCELDRELPRQLIRKLKRLNNYDQLVAYMLTNCPALALPLVDTPTASIIASDVGDGEDGNSRVAGGGGQTRGSGGSGGSNGNTDDGPDETGGGEGASGGNGSDDDGEKDNVDDGDNGHGNDPGKRDSSNPGKKR